MRLLGSPAENTTENLICLNSTDTPRLKLGFGEVEKRKKQVWILPDLVFGIIQDALSSNSGENQVIQNYKER